MDTSLIVRDLGNGNKTPKKSKEKGDAPREWTILDKQTNSLLDVTWAEMIDEVLGVADENHSTNMEAEKSEEQTNNKDKVITKEAEKPVCRNVFCLFFLSSSILLPLFFASLNIFINCHQDLLSEAQQPVKNVENFINVSNVDGKSSFTKEYLHQENNSMISYPVFNLKALRKDKDSLLGDKRSGKALAENFYETCLLPYFLLFGTTFTILLTFSFIIGYSCGNMI